MADDARAQTLLAHLIPRFAHPENVAVDALGHIFSSSAAARGALTDLLHDAGADVGSIAGVTTQATGDDGERPDLAAVDNQGTERLLIEAKFWAGLTENQPVAYLERLPTDEPSALLVIAPEARRVSLWAELRELVDGADGLDWRDASRTPDQPCADVGGAKRLVFTSWAGLLTRMATRASVALDTDAELDIRQLRGLADRMDEDAFLPLRSEELAHEFARRLLDFQRLFEDARQSAADRGIARPVRQEGSSGTFRGQRVRIAGARAWFGIRYDLWARRRTTPLWLRFFEWEDDPDPVDVPFSEARRSLAPLTTSDPPGLFEDGADLLVPIMLPTGVEYDDVLESILQRLAEIASLLASGAQ